MKTLILLLALLPACSAVQTAAAQEPEPVVQLAVLVIDPAYLEPYKALLREGIEQALRLEPGVIALYALSEKDNPTHITIVETYASAEAYRAHLQTPHFLKYKEATRHMVLSLELIETAPLLPALGIRQTRPAE